MRALRNSCGRGLVLAVAACFCLPVTGRADMFPFGLTYDVDKSAIEEDEKQSATLPLRLEEDEASPTHRIVIPAAVLAKLADVPLRARRTTSVSTTRSVAAGIALSAAVACGFLAYRRGRASRVMPVALVGLTVAGLGAGLVSTVHADVFWFPSPSPRRNVVELVTLRQGGRVILELAEADEEEIVIVIGRKAVPAD